MFHAQQLVAALVWTLHHHQGGSSPVGQPIRKLLGIGQFDSIPAGQLAMAKAWAASRIEPLTPQPIVVDASNLPLDALDSIEPYKVWVRHAPKPTIPAGWSIARVDERTLSVACPTFTTPMELTLDSADRKILAFYNLAADLLEGQAAETEAIAPAAVIRWTPVSTHPPAPDFYLVTVDTDSGRESHVLEWDGKHWMHEGEPTFCKSWMFRPIFWADRPAPCALPVAEEEEV